MKTLPITAALVLSLFVAAAAPAQQTADLRPRLTEGRIDRFDFHQEGRLELSLPDAPGMGGEQTILQEMRIALEIEEATEEGARGKITFERFALSLAGAGMDVAFDSDDPPATDDENPVAPLLRPLIGKSIGVRFDAAGNVVALTGVSEVLPSGALGGALGDLLGESGLKGGVTQITSSGGGAAVRRVGETWTTKDSVKLPEGGGKFEMTTTHKLKSVQGQIATVTLTGDMQAKSADADGLDVRSASLEGRYEWDTERGMVRSLQFDRRLSFEVNRSGVKAHVKQDVQTRVRRVDGR